MCIRTGVEDSYLYIEKLFHKMILFFFFLENIFYMLNNHSDAHHYPLFFPPRLSKTEAAFNQNGELQIGCFPCYIVSESL